MPMSLYRLYCSSVVCPVCLPVSMTRLWSLCIQLMSFSVSGQIISFFCSVPNSIEVYLCLVDVQRLMYCFFYNRPRFCLSTVGYHSNSEKTSCNEARVYTCKPTFIEPTTRRLIFNNSYIQQSIASLLCVGFERYGHVLCLVGCVCVCVVQRMLQDAVQT